MSTISLRENVRRILLSDWDPIGISGQPNAQDEYDIYVSKIVDLANNNVTPEALAAHLLKVVKEQMGLSGDPSRASQVAAKILAAR